jgi:hypothetical protein
MNKFFNTVIFTSALGLALVINAMEPQISHKFMTIEELEKQVTEQQKNSLRSLNEENAYAQALWDAAPDRVKFFLDRNSKAHSFRKINQSEQFLGKGAVYVDKTPLDIVGYNRESDKYDKWAVYALLFRYGADLDNAWRNTRLKWATSIQPDAEFAQWLMSQGAGK